MGVKGLYSFLANEPSRFGHQWSTSQSTDVQIYIDAPALHHHLIQCFQRRINLPPSINLRDLDYSSTGVVSPCTIYKLTRAFSCHLLEAISPNSKIHFVFDGVASIYKEKQQVERIKENCLVFDQAARSFSNGSRGNNFHVPHLWGEDAMMEAVEAEAEADERLCVYIAHSEAESFIADMISATASEHDETTIVLSNDSDFLVFPSVPGFVPLHSLEYATSEEGDITIMGWEYTRQQFIAAHPQLEGKDSEESFLVTTALAAFAGCDYTLPTLLQRRISSARTIIVNSNISGLRQRDRNDPTARGTLLAVLRYICHFREKCETGEWLSSMVDSIVSCEGKDKLTRDKDLTMALATVRNVYRGIELEEAKTIPCTSDMVALKRLLLHRKLYCKPVMEMCEGAKTQGSTGRKSKGKKKKRTGTAAIGEDQIQLCGRSGQGGSLWMAPRFVECRDQLYGYLAHHYPPFCESDGDSCMVTEYCRAGGSNQIICKDFQATVAGRDGMTSYSGLPFFQVIARMMLPSIDDSTHEILVEDCLGPLSSNQHFALLASLLLESKLDVLLLLATILAPKTSVHRQKEYHTLLQWKEYMQSMGRIQIAQKHTKLIIDAAICFSECIEYRQCFSPRQAFCDESLLATWSIITDCIDSDMDECLLGTIKNKINRAFHINDTDWDDEGIDSIWRTWLQLNS